MKNLDVVIKDKEKEINQAIQNIKLELPNIEDEEKNSALLLLSILTESSILLIGINELSDEDKELKKHEISHILNQINDIIKTINSN
jgi:hypothetical protein